MMNYKIHHFHQLESTNTEALSGEYVEGDVVWSDYQSSGRGQRGNQWHSDCGENLTFSLVVEPNRPIYDSFHISMAISVAIVNTLLSVGIKARIKWPNDIYVGDLKIAGILVENKIKQPNIISKSVIGVGLNVNQIEFSKSIPNPTSVRLCNSLESQRIASSIGIDKVLNMLLEQFSLFYPMLTVELHKIYMNNLWRKDGYYPYSDGKNRFMAKIDSIEPKLGKITLVSEFEGEKKQFYFKEVQALLK